jgi:hypothetical protein
LHSIFANLRLPRGIGNAGAKKGPARSFKKLRYAFLVTVCRFKVSGLVTFKMATGCAVGKYRWDMTPTASVKLTATNPAEKFCTLSWALWWHVHRQCVLSDFC